MPKKRSPKDKKRKKLIRQKSNVNLMACAAFFGVPVGFLGEHWKFGNTSFLEIEHWLGYPQTERLLRMWEPREKVRTWIENCQVRYVHRPRSEKGPIKTTIRDCAVSRKKDQVLVKSGNQEFNFPLGMRTLEVRTPFSSEFKNATEVFS